MNATTSRCSPASCVTSVGTKVSLLTYFCQPKSLLKTRVDSSLWQQHLLVLAAAIGSCAITNSAVQFVTAGHWKGSSDRLSQETATQQTAAMIYCCTAIDNGNSVHFSSSGRILGQLSAKVCGWWGEIFRCLKNEIEWVVGDVLLSAVTSQADCSAQPKVRCAGAAGRETTSIYSSTFFLSIT